MSGTLIVVEGLYSMDGDTPDIARVVDADGSERETGLEAIRVGQVVRVRPGENLPVDGKVVRDNAAKIASNVANALWHSDSSFKAVPAKYSLLSARRIPTHGGNTEFADMRQAWDELDAETKATCADLICEHSQLYSRGLLGFDDFTDDDKRRFQPVRQRLVRTHPSTGRKSLFLASHAGTIEGWPVPEARAFLRDLNEHATQRKFVYAHVWKLHDLVMWDNRCMLHKANGDYDMNQTRYLYRVMLQGSVPV